MPRSTFVQTSSTKIPSPLSALHPANHRFFTPLFSSTSEPLFAQLLCFHIYLRCPLVFSSEPSIYPTSVPSVLGRSLKSFAINGLRPLVLSCSLFCSALVCFQRLADSFCKTPGVGYAASESQEHQCWFAILFFGFLPSAALPTPSPAAA